MQHHCARNDVRLQICTNQCESVGIRRRNPLNTRRIRLEKFSCDPLTNIFTSLPSSIGTIPFENEPDLFKDCISSNVRPTNKHPFYTSINSKYINFVRFFSIAFSFYQIHKPRGFTSIFILPFVSLIMNWPVIYKNYELNESYFNQKYLKKYGT